MFKIDICLGTNFEGINFQLRLSGSSLADLKEPNLKELSTHTVKNAE